MAKHVTCPSCESPLSLSPEMVGRRVKCRRCQQVLEVEDGWVRFPSSSPPAHPQSSGHSDSSPRRRRRRLHSDSDREKGLSTAEFIFYGIIFLPSPLLNLVLSTLLYNRWKNDWPL